MMAVNGILRQNFISYYLQDLVAFSMITFILVFNRTNPDVFPLVLIKVFSTLLFIGVIVFLISLLNTKFILTTTRFERSAAISFMIFNPSETITLVHFGPILIFFHKYLKRWQNLIALLSCLSILAFGFLTATRVTIVIALFPILYYAWSLTRKNLLKFSLLVSLIFFPLVFLYFNFSHSPVFKSTILRFEISENYTSYRTDEFDGFVKEYKSYEYAFGRGLGGAHYYGIWKDFSHIYGMNMAHFGFLHLFLKGGLILLIFIYFIDIRAIIRLIGRRNKDPLAIPFLFVILMFIIYEISHTRFLDSYYLIFLFSAISYSLNPNEAPNG